MRYDFLQPKTIAALGASQYAYTRRFTIDASTGSEPATQGSGPIAIQGGIHFFTESLWLRFPTVNTEGEDLVDDGVCRLTLKVSTGKSNPMFQNPTLLDLIGVPGRSTVSGAVTASGGDPVPGVAPHIPGFPFHYFIMQGSPFNHDFANTSNVAAVVDVFWRGWNIPAEKCGSVAEFWDIVARNQPNPVVE